MKGGNLLVGVLTLALLGFRRNRNSHRWEYDYHLLVLIGLRAVVRKVGY